MAKVVEKATMPMIGVDRVDGVWLYFIYAMGNRASAAAGRGFFVPASRQDTPCHQNTSWPAPLSRWLLKTCARRAPWARVPGKNTPGMSVTLSHSSPLHRAAGHAPALTGARVPTSARTGCGHGRSRRWMQAGWSAMGRTRPGDAPQPDRCTAEARFFVPASKRMVR